MSDTLPAENTASITDNSATEQNAKMKRADIIGFFLAGLLNNASYVIMIAGAKNIAPSMVGLVYVCNVVPSFLV